MRCQPRTAESVERVRRRCAGAEHGWCSARVADRVAERRQEPGLWQRALAHLTGRTPSAIARLEGGGRPPRIDTLLRISR